MAQLDGHPLDVLHAERDVSARVVAGTPRERHHVQQPLGPVAMPLVPVVGLLHPERHPPEARLREEDLELRQAIEHAAQHQLREAQRRRNGQER